MKPAQPDLLSTDEEDVEAAFVRPAHQPWPKILKDRATCFAHPPPAIDGAATLSTLALAFAGKRTRKRLVEILEILDMLIILGQAVEVEDGTYAVGYWGEETAVTQKAGC